VFELGCPLLVWIVMQANPRFRTLYTWGIDPIIIGSTVDETAAWVLCVLGKS